MKKITELNSLMTELLEEENTDLDNEKFSERALAIIKEISKFAKEQPLYQANRDKEKQFKTKTAWDVFTFMLFKIADALTEVQECTVVILLMPVLYDKLKSEGVYI